MSIERIKTIDLAKYSSDWEGSYIRVATRGWNDQMQVQKDVSIILKKINKLEAVLAAATEDQRETAELDLTIASEEMIAKITSTIIDRFRGGEIRENGVLRPLVKEDIMDLDQEIINEIGSIISGTNPKA